MTDADTADLLRRLRAPVGTLCADSLNDEAADCIDELEAEIERLQHALRTIAGYEQCTDNLMGNVDIARAALKEDPSR